MNPEQTSQNNGQSPTQNPQTPPPAPTLPPAVGEPGHDPYAFILNPEKPKKKPIPLPTGNSLLERIAIAGGALVVLLIAIVVVSSLISSGGKEKTAELLAVAQEQTELIRIATDGTVHATTIPGQNLAQDVVASLTSDSGTLTTYLQENGQKLNAATLALKRSKTDDTTLQTAQENNTYDSAFKTIIASDLTDYMSAVQKAYKANPGPNGKAILSKEYDSADILLKLSKE